MALATTIPFGDFLVLLGNGATPEIFGDPCGLTSRGFTRTANMNDTNIPDCDDPDAASWLGRDVISFQATIAGSGVVATESLGTWEDWWETGGLSKNIRVELGTTVWEGPFKLSELVITGERGQRVGMNVSVVSDGEVLRLA